MSPLQTQVFVFEAISTFEWYDGIVRAVGSFDQKNFLIVLAAWDIRRNEKAYVFLEIDSGTAERMKHLSSGSEHGISKVKVWDSLNQLFEYCISNHKEPCYLAHDQPKAGEAVSTSILARANLDKLANYDLENALTEAACLFWFGLVEYHG